MAFAFYLFVSCFAWQVAYQSVLLAAILLYKKKSIATLKKQDPYVAVSVIICAKNESQNLQKNIPYILAQDHPQFELIIVDDGSEDGTSETIKNLMTEDQRVKSVYISKEEKKGKGKKYALQRGVETARYNIVLLTDADCKPLTKRWMTEMSSHVSGDTKIVLGISPYDFKNSLLNTMIEYETAQTAFQYIGFAILGWPYMSVGRNVCYDKKLLSSKCWTDAELSIASGDDDLAVQSLANAANTGVNMAVESYTISAPEETWKEWINQKLRHYEPGSLYKLKHSILLGSYLLTKFLLYSLMVFYISRGLLSLFLNIYTGSPAAGILPFLVLMYIFFITFFQFILEKQLSLNKRWYFAPAIDIAYCVSTLFLGLTSRFKKTRTWNEKP